MATAKTPKTPSQQPAKRDEAMRLCELAKDWITSKMSFSKPWQGVEAMPVKANGTPYVGINIPVLLAQMEHLGEMGSGRFGSFAQFVQVQSPVKKGEKALHAIFAGTRKIKKDDPDSGKPPPKEEEEEEADFMPMFNAIPLFHISQTENWKLDIASEQATRIVKLQSIDEEVMKQFAQLARETAVTKIQEFNDRQLKAGNRLTGAYADLVQRLSADLVVSHQSGLGLEYAGNFNGPYSTECIQVVGQLRGGKIMRPWGIASAVMRGCIPGLDAQMLLAEQEAAKQREIRIQKSEKKSAMIWF